MTVVFLLAGSILLAVAEPRPSPTPILRPIGIVRPGSTVCGNLVVHANSAIDSAVHGDALVGRAIARLRKINLESNSPAKRDGLQELTRLAGDLGDDSLRGDSELKRLRELAGQVDGTPVNPDVRTFSDALSGVLGRQRRIAIDLNNFLSYLDYREMIEIPTPPFANPPPMGGRMSNPPPGVYPYVAPTPTATAMPPSNPYIRAGSPNRMASAAAADFEARMAQIRGDEMTAAAHSEAAVSGC